MKQDVSQPLFTLLDQWPSYVEDNDAQHHFLSCRDSIKNLQGVVSSHMNPIYKSAEANERTFNSALDLYEESGKKCQKALKMTDAELAALDQQKRKERCTKKTMIFDIDKGDMVEQPKPDYCKK